MQPRITTPPAAPVFTQRDLSLLADIANGFSTVLHYDRLDDLRKRLRALVEGSLPPTPPVTFLRTGSVPADAPHFVQFVDEDASGDLRLIEEAPESPPSIGRMCAPAHCRRSA